MLALLPALVESVADLLTPLVLPAMPLATSAIPLCTEWLKNVKAEMAPMAINATMMMYSVMP